MLQKISLTCLAALLLPLPALSLANSPIPPELFDRSLEELLDTPIRSASKYTQKSSEAPASVSVVSAEDIKRYGYRSLSQLLASLQGIYFISDNTYSSVGIRGFSRPNDYGTRIAVLIDGHRLNDNSLGSVDVGTGFPLDMDTIERVEVVRGSSSSLYGQGAFFGVIDVITKNATDYRGVRVSTEADVNPDRYAGNTTVGKTFANNGQLMLSAGISHRPGENVYIPEFDKPPLTDGISHAHDDHDIKRLFAKLSYKNFRLTASHIDREVGLHGTVGMLFDFPNQLQEHNSYVDASYSHEFNNSLETNIRLSWNHYAMHMKSYFDYGNYIAINHFEVPTEWLNAEWQWQWHNDKHRIVSGVEYQHSLSQQQRSYDEAPFYAELANVNSDLGYWAIYAQDEVKLTDKLTLNAGVRYDYYEAFGGTSNPRLAMIYQMNEDTTWKLLGGKAFRVPNAQEQYYADNLFLKRNPEGVSPETVLSYELVLNHQFNENLTGSASVFSYEVNDMIDAITDPTDFLTFYSNIGSAKASGLEMTLDKRWQNGLETHLNYTWQNAENGDTGQQLTNSPQHMLKVRASLPLSKKWRANAQLSYIDSMKTPHAALAAHAENAHTDVPAYTVTDLSLIGMPLKDLEIGLHIYNLLDQYLYYPLFDESSGLEKIQGDGRTLRLKLNYKF